ncbi:MAG: hypothetical protein V4730_06795 [Pseudomonadota bacterium]
MTDQLDQLPPMNQRDLYDVVNMWLQTFDRIRGADAAKGLIRLGEWLNFADHLLPLLKSRSMDETLLAMMALGLLKERRALPVIRENLDHPYPLLSLAAMKAFMDIAPEEGLPELMKRIDTPGWPMGRVRQLMSSAPRQLQTQYLAVAAETLLPYQLPHLMELVFALAPSESTEVAKGCLRRCPEQALLIQTILKHTSDPQFLPLARVGCRSTVPELRGESLLALGSLGGAEEQTRLIHHLDNDTWLNQQAAAKSLITLVHDASTAQSILSQLQSVSAQQHWSELLFEKGWLLNPDPAAWSAANSFLHEQVTSHG